MKELFDKLKAHLRANKDNYVDHSEWNGSTEGGFYDSDDFDIDKLMEEIDKFAAEIGKAKEDK